jgi:hypothetical protein
MMLQEPLYQIVLKQDNGCATRIGRPFSVPGQSRHFGDVPVTSGLSPTPDMALHRNN